MVLFLLQNPTTEETKFNLEQKIALHFVPIGDPKKFYNREKQVKSKMLMGSFVYSHLGFKQNLTSEEIKLNPDQSKTIKCSLACPH